MDRRKKLKRSSIGYELAKTITLIAQKIVVLLIGLKNHDLRDTKCAPVENANPIIVVTYII